ncbi:MAG TPA: DUF2950 domain-containing protein [Nitrospira sp.]|nr:DUF2950 domain-containing protein [Nitrospira sp.]
MPVSTVAVAAADLVTEAGEATTAAAGATTAGDMGEVLRLCRLSFVILTALLSMPRAAASDLFVQTAFSSPEEGMEAFVEAIKLNDPVVLQTLLGPEGPELFNSGDPAADAQWRKLFLKAYAEANKVVFEDQNGRAILSVGRDAWPMPIPLIKSEEGWRFDSRRAAEEILNRHIGRNELAAIQVCLAIAEAEREYATSDADGDGVPGFAARFVSSPGKRDGLYWETRDDEPLSPIGPLLAAAADEEASGPTSAAPFHGYLYRMFTKQGQHAPGGAYDYWVNGTLLGGFAVLAYPAHYGVSGVVSFMINQDGVVYQKDLGPNTAALAAEMSEFDPDPSWRRAP